MSFSFFIRCIIFLGIKSIYKWNCYSVIVNVYEIWWIIKWEKYKSGDNIGLFCF